MDILNVEPFLCKFRWLINLQNKILFHDRQCNFLLTGSGLHSTRMVLSGPNWPDLTMRGREVPQAAATSLHGVCVPGGDHLEHHKDNLGLLRPLKVNRNMHLSVSEPNFVFQISQPPITAQK